MEENTAKEMIIIFAQEQYSLEGKGVAMLTTLLHEPFQTIIPKWLFNQFVK